MRPEHRQGGWPLPPPPPPPDERRRWLLPRLRRRLRRLHLCPGHLLQVGGQTRRLGRRAGGRLCAGGSGAEAGGQRRLLERAAHDVIPPRERRANHLRQPVRVATARQGRRQEAAALRQAAGARVAAGQQRRRGRADAASDGRLEERGKLRVDLAQVRHGEQELAVLRPLGEAGQELVERSEPKLVHLGERRLLDRLEHVAEEEAQRDVCDQAVLHQRAKQDGGGAQRLVRVLWKVPVLVKQVVHHAHIHLLLERLGRRRVELPENHDDLVDGGRVRVDLLEVGVSHLLDFGREGHRLAPWHARQRRTRHGGAGRSSHGRDGERHRLRPAETDGQRQCAGGAGREHKRRFAG
mmetsp:Transcript_30039/g.95723  ORF Transcript_30039/g.95723 Transcript_30039/m.95723 type:complete len:352 (+) Transcript_30039:1235-2290(+)